MKSRSVVSLLATVLVFSVLAIAQNPSIPEKTSPLFFIKIAADVAGNVQSQSLDRFLAIYVSDENWASGAKDSDLGPFLKLKEAKPGRSAAFFFTQAKDAAICVFFDGKSPFGVVAVKAPAGGPLQPAEIAAAYKDVTQGMLKRSDQAWQFTEGGGVNADDGTALPAFQIAKGR